MVAWSGLAGSDAYDVLGMGIRESQDKSRENLPLELGRVELSGDHL